MSALLLLVPGTLLLLVFLAAGLQLAERRFPRFSRWLDERIGPEPEWRRW